jgi:hypothetical protein
VAAFAAGKDRLPVRWRLSHQGGLSVAWDPVEPAGWRAEIPATSG